MSDTAWQTAQSTGALAYMPYEEAEQYSNIYQAQSVLMTLEAKPLEDTSEILGLIARYNWHDIDKKIVVPKKITTEQAGAVAEKLTHAQIAIHELLSGRHKHGLLRMDLASIATPASTLALFPLRFALSAPTHRWRS